MPKVPSLPPSTVRLYARLFALLAPHKGRVVLLLGFMALTSGAYAFLLYLIKPIFDGMFYRTSDPWATFHSLATATIPLAAAAATVNFAASYGKQYLMGYLSQRVVQRLRDLLYERLIRLPMGFYAAHRTGGLASRVTNDALLVQNTVTQVFGSAVSSLLTTLALLVLMVMLDGRLTLLALVVFPVGVYPIYRFGRKVRRATGEGQEHLESLNSQIQETLSGVRVVKAFAMEDREAERFRGTNQDFFSAAMRSVRAQALSSPLVEYIGILAGLALFLWIAHRILIEGTLTPGDMVAFIAAVPKLYQQLKTFNGLWINVQQGLAAAERCFEVLDTQPEVETAAGGVKVGPLRRALEFDRVSFAYLPGRPVLREVSFRVQHGEVVALVGPSGAGKSTLADLVLRFYDPTEGRILWDGTDLRRVDPKALRSQIGVVTQETILFHDTVHANVAYGSPGASFSQVERAARAAHAHEFVRDMPKGYNTPVGDRGVRLSGGQRQRLAIARAVLRDPPFLILDEATSSLDSESERLVQKALDGLLGKRTSLVIAHRLSTVRRAHRILVLRDGRLVEQGRHAALLKKGGTYAKLYRMQFQTAPSSGVPRADAR